MTLTTEPNLIQDEAADLERQDDLPERWFEREDAPADAEGYIRPSYMIGGQRIVFRSRQEAPQYDVPYAVIAAEATPPAHLTKSETLKKIAADVEAYNAMPHASLEVARYAVVTNTPEGLVGAALVLGGGNERLETMYEHLRSGDYGPDELALIDSILAATNVSRGKSVEFDNDGYALVLASLMGDAAASEAVSARLDDLMRQVGARRRWGEEERTPEEREADIEKAADPHHLVLVHSTSHDIQRDTDGTVTLRPSSAMREDRFPRATLHFTVNGEVSSHLYGQWDTANRLIIANLQASMEANGVPEVMNPVDTFYSLSPGEQLRLPGALIIEPSAEQDELITRDGNTIRYKLKERYSDTERAAIDQLARQENVTGRSELSDAETLRQAVLHQGLREQGAHEFVTPGAYYTGNPAFDQAYHGLATKLGAGHPLHIYTADSHSEEGAYFDLQKDGAYSGALVEGSDSIGFASHVFPDATLAARRQIVASGYTQPAVKSEKLIRRTEARRDVSGV